MKVQIHSIIKAVCDQNRCEVDDVNAVKVGSKLTIILKEGSLVLLPKTEIHKLFEEKGNSSV